MTLIKRKHIYHARIKSTESKSGYVSISTKETDLARAKARIKEAGLDKVESAAQTHRLTSEGVARILAGKRITIEHAIVKWGEAMRNSNRAGRTIDNSLKVVLRWASEVNLLNVAPMTITPAHVGDWINSPDAKSGAANRRINLSILGQFLEFCTYAGWNMGNQAKLVGVNMNSLTHQQKEKKERLAFTKGEVSTLLQHLEDPFWKFAVRLSYETGLRLGDICQLEWECFERENEVAVWTDKRNVRIALPVSAEISAMLTSIPVTDARYVFPEQRGTVLDNDRRASLSVQFKRHCERADIEGKSFHCLRHTFTETHRQHGATWEEIAIALGHACEETSKGYATKSVGGKKK